jgi:NTP pyrophosphatase (non-canonical NTP hydrolase)
MINKNKQKKQMSTPFGTYFRLLDKIDKDLKGSTEYGSILILSLVEEVGEMARAYLAKHGRKGSNIAAQKDETYQQELGDILVTILRFARIKNIDLDKRIKYTLSKIEKRKIFPKL